MLRSAAVARAVVVLLTGTLAATLSASSSSAKVDLVPVSRVLSAGAADREVLTVDALSTSAAVLYGERSGTWVAYGTGLASRRDLPDGRYYLAGDRLLDVRSGSVAAQAAAGGTTRTHQVPPGAVFVTSTANGWVEASTRTTGTTTSVGLTEVVLTGTTSVARRDLGTVLDALGADAPDVVLTATAAARAVQDASHVAFTVTAQADGTATTAVVRLTVADDTVAVLSVGAGPVTVVATNGADVLATYPGTAPGTSRLVRYTGSGQTTWTVPAGADPVDLGGVTGWTSFAAGSSSGVVGSASGGTDDQGATWWRTAEGRSVVASSGTTVWAVRDGSLVRTDRDQSNPVTLVVGADRERRVVGLDVDGTAVRWTERRPWGATTWSRPADGSAGATVTSGTAAGPVGTAKDTVLSQGPGGSAVLVDPATKTVEIRDAAARVVGQVVADGSAGPLVVVGTGTLAWVRKGTPGDEVVVGTMPTAPVADGLGFVPITPTRMLDTRTTNQPLGAGAVREVALAAAVPAQAQAVALNVTAVDASTATFLRVWPKDQPMPGTSNLNATPGSTVAVAVVSSVSTDRKVMVRNNAGSVHLVVDVTGYYVSSGGAGFAPLATAARLYDSRTSGGHAPMTTQRLQVAGKAGVPADATAVMVNVTSASAQGPGHVTVVPAGGDVGGTSSLNLWPGADVANRATVPLSSDGKIDVYLHGGPSGVIVDVVGWYGPSGSLRLTPVAPQRVADTRDAALSPGGPVGQGQTRTLSVRDRIVTDRVPAAALVTLTATQQTAPATHLKVGAAGQALPPTSDLNTGAGRDQSAMALMVWNTAGTSVVYNNVGSTHVVIDVTAVFR